MRSIVKEMIDLAHEWIVNGDSESIHEDLNSVSLPLWDELSDSEKLSTLGHIYENIDDEDFTHSQCCDPASQAACAFCIEYIKNEDLLAILMDDLDFMMTSVAMEYLHVETGWPSLHHKTSLSRSHSSPDYSTPARTI